MRRPWLLALCASALALGLLLGPEAEAKKLEDCPVYKAITAQRRAGEGNRSAQRYANTRRTRLSTAGHITNGLKDVLIAPLEVPMTMRRVTMEKNLFAGMVGGPIEGLGNGLERMFSGAAEVVAAPIPGVQAPVLRRRLGASTAPPSGFLTDVVNNIIDQRQ